MSFSPLFFLFGFIVEEIPKGYKGDMSTIFMRLPKQKMC